MKPTFRIYWTAGIIVLIVVLFLLFVISPLISRISLASAGLLAKKQAIDNLYIDWLSLQSSQRLLSQIDRARLNGSLVNPDQTLDFILSIEKAVEKAGLRHEMRILTLSANGANQTNKKLTIPFQLTLWGSFPKLMTFLNYLDHLPYYLRIDIAQIKRVGDGGPVDQQTNLVGGDIQATINLQVFIQQ